MPWSNLETFDVDVARDVGVYFLTILYFGVGDSVVLLVSALEEPAIEGFTPQVS